MKTLFSLVYTKYNETFIIFDFSVLDYSLEGFFCLFVFYTNLKVQQFTQLI